MGLKLESYCGERFEIMGKAIDLLEVQSAVWDLFMYSEILL